MKAKSNRHCRRSRSEYGAEHLPEPQTTDDETSGHLGVEMSLVTLAL
jgi:hypothetical protein